VVLGSVHPARPERVPGHRVRSYADPERFPLRWAVGHSDRSSFGHPDRPTFGHPDRPTFGDSDRPTFGDSDRSAFGHADGSAFGHADGSAFGHADGSAFDVGYPDSHVPTGDRLGQHCQVHRRLLDLE
jgi:hypothetical protein